MQGLTPTARARVPDLLLHMGPPVGEKVPGLPDPWAFHAVAMPTAWVPELLRNYSKLGRLRSPFFSANVLDRDGDNLVRPYRSFWAQRLRILVVGVTPKPEVSRPRRIYFNAPSQALKSLAQNLYRRLRFHFLVTLYPGTRGAAQAFAEKVGISDVVVYSARGKGPHELSVLDMPEGRKTVLIPGPADGWSQVRVEAFKTEKGRYRVRDAAFVNELAHRSPTPETPVRD